MLFKKLVSFNRKSWNAYINHSFPDKLFAAQLSPSEFKYYLLQDYFYLLEYGRAFLALGYKSSNYKEMVFAVENSKGIIYGETKMYQDLLKYNIEADVIKSEIPSLITNAYTNYFNNLVVKGEYIDLLVALAACTIGYGTLAQRLLKKYPHIDEAHPYKSWIDEYASQDFKMITDTYIDFINQYSRTINLSKLKDLNRIFGDVCRLEIAFFNQCFEHARFDKF